MSGREPSSWLISPPIRARRCAAAAAGGHQRVEALARLQHGEGELRRSLHIAKRDLRWNEAAATGGFPIRSHRSVNGRSPPN
jgi:hypothetical protein